MALVCPLSDGARWLCFKVAFKRGAFSIFSELVGVTTTTTKACFSPGSTLVDLPAQTGEQPKQPPLSQSPWQRDAQ